MDEKLVQILYQRRAQFAPTDPNKPFSPLSLSHVIVVLTKEESEELRRLSYERETRELSKRRCSNCATGRIVEEKVPRTDYLGRKVHTMRYDCTCDESKPIDLSEWVPIGENSPIE